MTTDSSPPYRTYATLVASFGAGLTAVAGLATLLGRQPERLTSLDLAVLSAATFKASRTITSDEVTSFIRDPFVKGEAHEGKEEAVEDGGPKQALGELLTCSRCIGAWTAAGLVSAHVLAPRAGRLLSWSLAASAANDFLQAGFAALTAKSNELEQRAGDD
ncbi:MAG: DUF1360 domain-containing protein [Actinobacteria bacterium]|nr:DUF1360 domain-containing protein [Actinomycetota bacterium]